MNASTTSDTADTSSQVENALTARVVLALRDEDVPNVVPPINSQTMERLVTDLELRHSARDWLREARRILREARFKEVIAPKSRGGESPERTAASSTHFYATRLVARQTSEGGWLVGIRLPDFGHLLQELKFPTKMLAQTRIKLTVGATSWMPGAALLSLANSEHRLPSIGDSINLPVLDLERDIRGLGAMLAGALSIQGKTPWLFRIQEDGVARQVIGNHVRAGQSYLILSDDELAPTTISDLGLRSVDSGLIDGSLYALDMPAVLSAHALRALAVMGLGYALTANIEAVGATPRWDGTSGCMVWLTTEEPILRLSADYPVREFLVTVDRRSTVRIACGNAAEAFVTLGSLEPGTHTIEVGGLASGGVDRPLAVERFEILVRPPVPWSQGVRERAGFRATLEPAGASLESALSGAACVSLIGPPERSVTVGARLFNLNGHMAEVLNLGSLPSLTDDRSLSRIIARLKDDSLAEKIQTAPRVDLTFVVDELGMDTIRFSHRVHPLRWKLAVDGQIYRLRLIDEAGADRPVIINRYPINRPDTKETSDYASFRAGQEVQSPGALFTAILDNKHYAAIVSVPTHLTLRTFQGLGAAIVLAADHDTPRHIPRLLALRRLWGRAMQTVGPLGMLRKSEVCRALELRTATIFCGAAWVTKAENCRSLNDAEFDQLRRGVGGSPGFAYRLRETSWHGGVELTTYQFRPRWLTSRPVV